MHIINPIRKVATIILLILFIVPSISFTQQLSREELDSLYQKFIQVRAPHLLEQPELLEELSVSDKKCGFGIVNGVKINFENFSTEQQVILKPLLDRPTMQTSIVSPSGIFRIHYDITGSNIPSYLSGSSIETNVQEVAKAMDSTYRFEVDYLGYPVAPSDGGAGGDYLYDVYIVNQPAGLYGFTQFEYEINPPSDRFTSYLVLDNDYTGYFSAGVYGLRVTAAHEFHHAIQGGNYIFRSSDTYYYEITSTAMEEFVYDDVNDYFQYLSSYFAHPDLPMPQQNGYNMAIWNIYLKETFGFTILKTQWELMPDFRAITSINSSIISEGSALPREFNKFGIWTFFTNYRAIPGIYFEDGTEFPLITPAGSVQFTPPSEPVHMTANPVTNNFIKFIIPSTSDTLYTIVSNGDAASAITNVTQEFGFDYELFDNPNSGQRKLTAEYSSDFSVVNPTYWSVSEILNNQIVYEDSVPYQPAGSISYAYPNPFTYEKNYITGSLIFLPADLVLGEMVDFNVYSVGMQLFYNKEEFIKNLPGDQKGVVWDGLDNDGNKLGSGVYIYVIKNGDDVVKGKVVIFNE